jgi:hypothetical protein
MDYYNLFLDTIRINLLLLKILILVLNEYSK